MFTVVVVIFFVFFVEDESLEKLWCLMPDAWYDKEKMRMRVLVLGGGRAKLSHIVKYLVIFC